MATLVPGQFTPGPLKIRNVIDVTAVAARSISDGRGNWTPYNAAAEFFDTIEIRTKATPPITFNVRTLEDPTPNPILQQLKPAIILRGPLGTKVIAPYGEVPGEDEGIDNAWKLLAVGIGALGAIGVVGFLAGAARQKIKARRKARREAAP